MNELRIFGWGMIISAFLFVTFGPYVLPLETWWFLPGWMVMLVGIYLLFKTRDGFPISIRTRRSER
jgi:hypothetical protein